MQGVLFVSDWIGKRIFFCYISSQQANGIVHDLGGGGGKGGGKGNRTLGSKYIYIYTHTQY